MDLLFSDRTLAGLYDALCPREERDDLDYYLPLVLASEAVLDVGCGTGTLLREARERGHTGRLVGLDPAPAMLERARRRHNIEWTLGALSSVAWDHEFDLVVMTGHAFQTLVNDTEIGETLAGVRRALTRHGRFAFETRNPRARAWELWHSTYGREIRDAAGATVLVATEVVRPFDGRLVSFTHTFSGTGLTTPLVSESTQRFVEVEELRSYVAEAGLIMQECYGDWDRRPFTGSDPEIIVVARKAEGRSPIPASGTRPLAVSSQ